MAGIYIHIPFCKQACHYCDFHFSTNQLKRNELTKAIVKELELQKDYLENEPVRTIYFGGGTPSLLSFSEVSSIIEAIRSAHDISQLSEVTLEANPDDLTLEKLNELKSAGITRLSIGLQSFNDSVLKFLNRSHDAQTGVDAFERARKVGFSNISIDLIYATPAQSLDELQEDIGKAIALNPEHISAYTLTIEPNTVFGRWASKGKLTAASDETAAKLMEVLGHQLEVAGYDHYEVSNFGKPGFQSQHNSSYWKQQKYLGVGPSAHSYNEATRQFNVSNNHIYLRSMQEGNIPFQREVLAINDKINEYILTSLRTSQGCDTAVLKAKYGFDLPQRKHDYLVQLTDKGLAVFKNDLLLLTRSGRLLADKIASDLFQTDSHR